MARKKKFKIDKDDIAYEEDVEECCFTDYIPTDENSIQLFSIENDLAHKNKNINANNSILETTEEVNKKIESSSNHRDNKTNNNLSPNTLLFDNRNTPIANGAAPPIDGETANIKRSYTLRKSTVRKINELKSIHPDINVCVSTIVDIAIAYYHEHILNDNLH
ncbi:hypothetical protein FDB55_01960 [Clostridium botulinum]|uniref:hypothetical protein n=1 Tax=Clostridium botulinum TaxID=1491 RepID=UPI0013F066B4|nr:hypothetical protein [Clostridium botulinum]MCS6110976.1 hypothetical protein [Clostridium botulinum]NFE10711.1 hypothetical protein [Clostridium botulinum]NFL42246.1 hypothetical protein [Clostridium botulinum]NFN20517.1 hypothetical protein [Clostridium botulinum]NFN41269.1 hypothetical protein [Clostridium botulinum]